MKTLDYPTAPYQVGAFNRGRHSGAEVARTHLAIRQWQTETQGVVFSNLYESWEELHVIEASYLEPGGNFFVAEEPASGKIVGHVGIMNGGEGTGVLKRMGVLPEYHRSGVGASLVTTALEWARQSGLTQIALTTGVIENAKPFYEKFGFQEIGRVLRNKDYVMELLLGDDSST